MLNQDEVELCSDCKRLRAASSSKPLLSSEDILFYLDHFRTKKQEYIVCLSLDSGQKLIARRIVTIGSLTASISHPREIFAGAIADRAAGIIVAHNHPSGDATPSKQDIEMTQQLVAAGQILGVPLYDHIIVARVEHYSFKKNQLIL